MAFDDQRVRALITVDFLVADYINDPQDTAERLLHERLKPLIGSEWDWGGRFIVATDVAIESEVGG